MFCIIKTYFKITAAVFAGNVAIEYVEYRDNRNYICGLLSLLEIFSKNSDVDSANKILDEVIPQFRPRVGKSFKRSFLWPVELATYIKKSMEE